jgi:hypothetical protein
MLVNARLLYISVDESHYNSGGQVILTVNPFGVDSLLDRLRITLSNRDRTRPYETINITIFVSCLSFSLFRPTLFFSLALPIYSILFGWTLVYAFLFISIFIIYTVKPELTTTCLQRQLLLGPTFQNKRVRRSSVNNDHYFGPWGLTVFISASCVCVCMCVCVCV